MDLEARAIEQFVPRPSTRQQRREHRAPALKLRAGIRWLQNRIKEEYGAAYDKQTEISTSRVSKGKRDRAAQLVALYQRLKDEDVVSRIPDDAVFATPNEARAAKLLPLFNRDRQTRVNFWLEKLNTNILASHIGRGCAIIDVRCVLLSCFPLILG